MVRQMSELETNVVAVERTKEYSDPKNNEVRRGMKEGEGEGEGLVKMFVQKRFFSQTLD